MVTALDATPLSVPTGGIARYTAELSKALAETFPDDEFWLISDQPFPMAVAKPANLHSALGSGSLLDKRWWSCGVAATLIRSGIDVFHGTDFAVPYLPLRPSVLTLHDLSPWKLDWQPAADRVRRRTPFLIRTGLATLVITPTEAVRRETIARFRIHPSRIVAVPHAASSLFQPVKPGPRSTLYFLFVGTLEPRKNISMLIEAWRAVRRKHIVDLVLVGRRREDAPTLLSEPGLRILGEVPDDALPRLYSEALVCVCPSLYEGFSLPVLEAMRCGAAVLSSRDPAIQEVTSGAALYLDALDTRAWVEAMTAALAQPEWLSRLRQQALLRAREFSWTRTARLTREVYEEARRQFRR